MQAARMAAQQSSADLAQQDAMPYQAGFEQRWPDMLGSIHLEDRMPKVDLQNGRLCPLLALSSQECSGDGDPEGFVACLSLSPVQRCNYANHT